MAQLKARRVRKTYLALVAGSPAAELGRIEAPIGRDPRNYRRMAVVPAGRPAITGYRARERFADWTLLEVDLHTGRTHQIRVHLEAVGLPVSGDSVYGVSGDLGLARQFLHAARLAFPHPLSGRQVDVESPLPTDLAAALKAARSEPA